MRLLECDERNNVWRAEEREREKVRDGGSKESVAIDPISSLLSLLLFLAHFLSCQAYAVCADGLLSGSYVCVVSHVAYREMDVLSIAEIPLLCRLLLI